MSNLLFLYILLIIVVTLFNVFSWGSSILHLERCFHVFESKICGHGLLIHRTSQLIQCGMDKGVTGQEFSSLKSTSSQRKNEGRVWAAMTFVALLRPGAIQFQFHYNSFQLWEACAKIALKWSLLFPLFCAPCLPSFNSWFPEPYQTGLQAGNLQGPARALPSPLPTGLGREGRPGLYGDEWMKKSKPQQALLCRSIKRSSGTAGTLIMRQTQEEKEAGLRGRTPLLMTS